MSAALTVEDRTAVVRPSMVDRLGYMYCADCDEQGRGHGRGHGPYPDAIPRYPWRSTVSASDIETDRACDIGQRCGGCGIPLAAFPTREVRVQIVVEHTPCRIF